MKFNFLLLYSGLLYGSSIYAAPEDLFLQANDFTKNISPPFQLTLGLDAVDEKINIFDIRKTKSLKDNNIGNYRGVHLAAEYQFNPKWGLEGSYWYREINYYQNTNIINSFLLGIHYSPSLETDKDDKLSFRASIGKNEADELSKLTRTKLNERTFEKINIHQPQDLNFQIDSIFSHKISQMNKINIFTSLGYTQVEVKNLNIQAKFNNCLIDIMIDSSNQFTGNLANPCSISNMLITQFNVSGNANEYGMNIQKDFNYDSYYASFGSSWNWRYQNFESQLAYQYQYLWRNDIDDRISSFGNQAIRDNHSLGGKFSYDFTPQITAFIKGELYQHNFVGHIPFLYNVFTAPYLNRRYGIATIGITINNF